MQYLLGCFSIQLNWFLDYYFCQYVIEPPPPPPSPPPPTQPLPSSRHRIRKLESQAKPEKKKTLTPLLKLFWNGTHEFRKRNNCRRQCDTANLIWCLRWAACANACGTNQGWRPFCFFVAQIYLVLIQESGLIFTWRFHTRKSLLQHTNWHVTALFNLWLLG